MRNKTKKKDQGSNENVVVAQDGYKSSEMLLVAATYIDKQWILDSRYYFHMTPNKDLFEKIKLEAGGHVLLGNKLYKIMGIGSVRRKMCDGVEWVLQNVMYISELKMNLISLGTLDINWYMYKAEGGVLRVIRGYFVIMKCV